MPRPQFLYALTLGLLLAACSDPQCPRDMVQTGKVCRKCEPGLAPKGGVCRPVVGDASIDPVEIDDDAEVPWDWDADVETDADAALVEADGSVSVADSAVDASAPCYTDLDGDGVGAGAPVECGAAGVDSAMATSAENTDCDDNNAQRSPRLTDVCGDKVDNDCDGMVDEESNNACGGSCSVQLAHQPGESCTNGRLGACARTGTYECQGTVSTACGAPVVVAIREVCGDNMDNDCDGLTDEPDAVDAQPWYQDCDGDGYARNLSVPSCSKPPATSACANWLPIAPSDKVTLDCDDTSSSYKPGAPFGLPPAGKTSFDLNCDGNAEKESALFQLNTVFGNHPVSLCTKNPPSECNCGLWASTQGSPYILNPPAFQPDCSVSETDYHPGGFTAISCEWVGNIQQSLQRCR